MPPLAVPSILVSTMPVTLTTSANTRACRRPFLPVVASSSKDLVDLGFLLHDAFDFASSSMRPVLVCNRPAVSMMTVSAPCSMP